MPTVAVDRSRAGAAALAGALDFLCRNPGLLRHKLGFAVEFPAMRFMFGDHVLDAARRELRRADELIAVEPQVFDLLLFLMKNRDRVVSRDDLIENVWKGRIVSDATVDSRIRAARHAVGDSGAGQELLRTFARKGVRFVADTREEGELVQAEPASVLALADEPSIAVLPFQNLSGDPDQEYFVDGMAEEIITALSHIRWLFVLARNSSFTYKGQSVDVKQIGRELGVHYVLEGSVRKAGNRVRITGQLIDATSGTHLWADRFDGSLEDVFDIQDKVAASVAGVIEPALLAAETTRSIDRATSRPTADLTAYDLYLRAYALYLASARQVPEALRLLEQAIARDPHYAPALALAAFCIGRVPLDGRSDAPAVDRLKGIDFARRALELASHDPAVLVNVAHARAHFGEDIFAALALVDRALALNPNYARAWHVSGIHRVWAGQPDIAIEHTETSLRLSPRARVGPTVVTIGYAHFVSRRFAEAVPKLLIAIQDDPSFPQPYRWLAACYAHLGRLDDAREMVERLRALPAVVEPDASFLRNAEHRELFLSGLRLAAGAAR
jgi:TolB-like protein